MKFGYFDEKNREYVITRPDTPTPWINYLNNSRYCAIISQNAGGYSFDKDAKDRRIIRYRFNNIPMDRPGRYTYIRDDKTKEYWTPTWQPVVKPIKDFECRHGLNYTIIKSKYNNIESEATYLVPLDDDLEIWMLKIKNTGKKLRNLSIFPYAEFGFWNAMEDLNIQWVPHITMSDFENNSIYFKFLEPHPPFDYKDPDYQGDKPGFAFFTSNKKAKGFECDRDKFIGAYHSENNPQAVIAGKTSKKILRGGNGCGALHLTAKLKPGQEDTIIVMCGFCLTKEIGQKMAAKYKDGAVVLKELGRIKSKWQDYLSNYQIQTPDKEANLFFNVWNQYQCNTTFWLSRVGSYYETGMRGGMGYRDSCQDVPSVLHVMSKEARERIKFLSNAQHAEGGTYHVFSPITGRMQLKGFSDDPMWLVTTITSYIQESGDLKFMDEIVPLADNGGNISIYEHIQRALEYTHTRRGDHGIPLIGNADWNDTLNLWGDNRRGESVMVAQQFVLACREAAELAARIGKTKDAEQYMQWSEEMKKTINEVAWDGEWYIRAFGDRGEPIGSHKCVEGKIFLNSQSWALISGVADKERGIKCMDSARKYMFTKFGMKALEPPFSKYSRYLGIISRYNLDRKENGGIFSHTNPWVVAAECILGRGELALEYYKTISPVSRNNKAEQCLTEPYVTSQSLVGPHNPNFGNGSNSWMTGSATTMFGCMANNIMGITGRLDGLDINPCIPKAWKEVGITRNYRGTIYKIKVINSAAVNKGVKKVLVDGKPVTGLVPPKPGQKECNVELHLG